MSDAPNFGKIVDDVLSVIREESVESTGSQPPIATTTRREPSPEHRREPSTMRRRDSSPVHDFGDENEASKTSTISIPLSKETATLLNELQRERNELLANLRGKEAQIAKLKAYVADSKRIADSLIPLLQPPNHEKRTDRVECPEPCRTHVKKRDHSLVTREGVVCGLGEYGIPELILAVIDVDKTPSDKLLPDVKAAIITSFELVFGEPLITKIRSYAKTQDIAATIAVLKGGIKTGGRYELVDASDYFDANSLDCVYITHTVMYYVSKGMFDPSRVSSIVLVNKHGSGRVETRYQQRHAAPQVQPQPKKLSSKTIKADELGELIAKLLKDSTEMDNDKHFECVHGWYKFALKAIAHQPEHSNMLIEFGLQQVYAKLDAKKPDGVEITSPSSS